MSFYGVERLRINYMNKTQNTNVENTIRAELSNMTRLNRLKGKLITFFLCFMHKPNIRIISWVPTIKILLDKLLHKGNK